METLPRSAVRLLPGPFLDAQLTALDYLLSLDVDRLLAPLRREAGLPPVAESYGNWENSGLDGHTVGHALSGAALMSAATDDPRPRAMVERLVKGIVECQDALETGYVGGIYFPLAEPERLQERRAELRAADGAALALRDRTVDAVAAGEQQPESDHRFRGRDTWSGLTDGLRWRAAGGWWSYRLTDPDGAATGLQVIHLSDVSAGLTRVLVDGRTLGTITPSPDREGEEISQVFPLDADRPAGPVGVRFEAAGPETTVRLREVSLLRQCAT